MSFDQAIQETEQHYPCRITGTDEEIETVIDALEAIAFHLSDHPNIDHTEDFRADGSHLIVDGTGNNFNFKINVFRSQQMDQLTACLEVGKFKDQAQVGEYLERGITIAKSTTSQQAGNTRDRGPRSSGGCLPDMDTLVRFTESVHRHTMEQANVEETDCGPGQG